MIGLIDPNAAADEFRGVSHEVSIEAGHNFPVIIDVGEAVDVGPETLETELQKLSDAMSDAYRSIEARDPEIELTAEQEARLIKLLDTRNRTEALRFMGIDLPEEISAN